MKGAVGAIIAVVVVAAALLIGVGVLQASLSNTGTHYEYTEDFDPGTNQTHVTLNESSQNGVYYDASVNVTGENASVMRPGLDYTWHESNGTLTVLDNGNLDGDATATITYGLRIPSEQQKTTIGNLGQIVDLAYAVPIILAAALVVIGAGVLGGLT
jgi:hypothetical protein